MARTAEPPGGFPETANVVRRLDATSLATLADRTFDGFPWLVLRPGASEDR